MSTFLTMEQRLSALREAGQDPSSASVTGLPRIFADRALSPLLGLRNFQEYDRFVHFLEGRYKSDRTIWGVSGFATAGYPYEAEIDALKVVYQHWITTQQMPEIVIDGGVSSGCLAANAIIAAMNKVQTLGFIPTQGRDSMSFRDYMVFWGRTYRQRETLVGTVPDALLCVGGGEGSLRECVRAAEMGSAVLILAPRVYGATSLPRIFRRIETLAHAEVGHRLVICDAPPEELAEALVSVLHTLEDAIAAAHTRREMRLQELKPMLGIAS